MKRFGISTHLFHSERLQPDHLVAIADHGFEAVELFATKSHFNYHDLRMIDELAGWLRDTGLEMPSVHAPIVDSLVDDRWGRPFSTATRDAAAWQMTMTEMHRALEIARRLPFRDSAASRPTRGAESRPRGQQPRRGAPEHRGDLPDRGTTGREAGAGSDGQPPLHC